MEEKLIKQKFLQKDPQSCLLAHEVVLHVVSL
jgi:hypothetical protein